MNQTLSIPTEDAVEYMFERGWTDGLPVIPPTRDKVSAMLAAGGREADELLGSVPARRRSVSAEILAANAVMAGCRPEYFPIVVTAMEAVLDPAFNVNAVATSTGGATVCMMVSGPMVSQIGMNGGHNAMGPGNRANATIGRAIRLTMANALGAKSGMLDASSLGHPGKYTFCFAERAPVDPWLPLNVRMGYTADDTTVTILAAEGPRQVSNHLNEDPESVLLTFVAAMKAPSNFIVGKGGQVAIVMGYEHELALRQAGWTQDKAVDFLVEHSRVTLAELEGGGIALDTAQHNMQPGPDGKYPVVKSAEDIILVSAGGPGSGWSAMIPTWAPTIHTRALTRRVRPVGEAQPDCGEAGCEVPWLRNSTLTSKENEHDND
ncbi:hypothetical protein [Caballeronia sp. J97]|uniref:hypothetical protein n=1 Tax=Caballeronia sp. J97 TaxID=2805429 RepID=UPI002AAF7A8E|nr:hypothetical protein [Caballeronia sp. J97]